MIDRLVSSVASSVSDPPAEQPARARAPAVTIAKPESILLCFMR